MTGAAAGVPSARGSKAAPSGRTRTVPGESTRTHRTKTTRPGSTARVGEYMAVRTPGIWCDTVMVNGLLVPGVRQHESAVETRAPAWNHAGEVGRDASTGNVSCASHLAHQDCWSGVARRRCGRGNRLPSRRRLGNYRCSLEVVCIPLSWIATRNPSPSDAASQESPRSVMKRQPTPGIS